MARTLLRQSQVHYTTGDLVGYNDGLATQLDATNHPETATGTTLIAAESATFSASGSVIAMSAANPLTSGVVPGDDVIIAGSTSDDGAYVITAVSVSTITVDHTFVGSDGGSATAAVASVRNLLTDLNYLRAQVRRVIGEPNWYDVPTSANSPVLKDRKVIYATENYTDINIPTAGFADVSGLGLSGYVSSSSTDEGILAHDTPPSNGGHFKSEGRHWVDLVEANSGEPITIDGHRVYGYLIVDDFDAPTTERVYFVYFNNLTDAEVVVTDLSTQMDQYGATAFELTYLTRSNLADVPEDFGLAPIHLEAAIDTQASLQEAYNKGNTITLSDAKGDLVITLDNTGTPADFLVTDSNGDYISTDAENSTLDLGSSNIQVDINGALTVTGANTFDVGTGQATFAGNVDADAGLDVTGTTNLGDGGSAHYAQFDSTGDLSFVGSADSISKSDGSLTVSVDSNNLVLKTTTSGDVVINPVSAVDIDAASLDVEVSGGFSIDSGDDSNISVTDGNLDLQTLTSGNINLASAGELTFDDQHWADGTADPLPFADSGNTEFAGILAGSISLIDALNTLEDNLGEEMDQADTVPGAVDRDTDVTIPGGLEYTAAADFVSDFLIFVNGVKMRNGVDAAANFDVYPGSETTKIRFEFKLKSGDVVSAVKIA